MVQIVKRKKQGRASRRRELRRSGRRRNVRYNFDFDEEDEEEEEYLFVVDEEEDQKPCAKKLKLHAPQTSHSHQIQVKKGRKKDVIKEVESAPGTPTELPSGFPLPDKKILVLILDKLQKKDIYGAYAEPVDPEELPDYHDIIEHPMDFSTIRSQLANGIYVTLEQLERDVLLLCSNSMQYNAPDTVYHRQARSIEEMAKKKFQKLRIGNGRSKNQMKLDPNPKSASLSDKQLRRQTSQIVQELVGSDFSSGATFATAGDFQNCCNAVQIHGIRKASSSDGLVEGIPPVIDASSDKVSISGKGFLTRFGRKLSVHDENCCATYNISTHPEIISESVFLTFDEESKQLIPVGLYSDHAYASSLARFAGSLGPVAWKVASQRIEQILSPGSKFGRGWVGEYEPLPIPVLMLETCNIKEPDYFAQPQHTNNTNKGNKPRTSIASVDNVTGPSSYGELQYSFPNGLKTSTTSSTKNPATNEPVKVSNLEGKTSLYCSSATNTHAASSPHLQNQTSAASSPHFQQQTSQMRKLIEQDKNVSEQVEMNGPPSISHSTAHMAVERQVSTGREASTPRSVETVPINRNFLHSGTFKRSNVGVVAGGFLSHNATLSNWNVAGTVDGGRRSSPCSGMGKVGTLFPQGQEQSLSDPVQQMRMLTEKNLSNHKSANQCTASGSPISLPAQSTSREDSVSASSVAGLAWMSTGAGGVRPVGENMGPPMQISAMTPNQQPQLVQSRGNSVHMVQYPQQNSLFHAYAPRAVRVHNAAQFQNRPMGLPQFLSTDVSRIQVQFPWKGLMPHAQQSQNQETSPPDLNASFQSPGSPGKPLAGVPVDQQPDLALQL